MDGRVDPDILEAYRQGVKAKEDEVEFHKALNSLANLCRFQLSHETLEIYDTTLSRYGYKAAAQALMRIILTRKANDPFPAASDILDQLNPKIGMLNPVEVANRIWDSVARFGYVNEKGAKDWCGVIGAEVIEQFGWNSLCEQPASNGNTVKAQLRETAKAVIERHRGQVLSELLALPHETAQIEAKKN